MIYKFAWSLNKAPVHFLYIILSFMHLTLLFRYLLSAVSESCSLQEARMKEMSGLHSWYYEFFKHWNLLKTDPIFWPFLISICIPCLSNSNKIGQNKFWWAISSQTICSVMLCCKNLGLSVLLLVSLPFCLTVV